MRDVARYLALMTLLCTAPVSAQDLPRERIDVTFLASQARRLDVSNKDIMRSAGILGTFERDPMATSDDRDKTPQITQKRLSQSRLDLMLRRISISASKDFIETVLRSQPKDESSAIIIESGSFGLAEIRSALKDRGHEEYLAQNAAGYVAHRPIVIWKDASLLLAPGDSLTLDGSNGSFLLNGGYLRISNARVQGLSPQGGTSAGFKPFVLTAFTGNAIVADSHFTDLGFGSFPESSGLAFANHQFGGEGRKSSVQSNTFERVNSLSLHEFGGVDILDNRFIDSTGDALSVFHARNVLVGGNVIAHTNGHGIKISNASKRISVSGNAILSSTGNGIYVTDASVGTAVQGNLVALNEKAGISVEASACVSLNANTAIANGSGGIAIRKSLSAIVADNFVFENRLAGLSIREQFHDDFTRVSGNKFAANRFGLSGDQIGAVALSENDFARQLPRIGNGEFATLVGAFLTQTANDPAGTSLIEGNGPSSVLGIAAFSPYDLAACANRKDH